VLLGPDETPESALAGSAFKQVWRAVQALSAHDDRLGRWMRELPQHAHDAKDRARWQNESQEALPPWLKFSGVPVPAGFVDAMRLRIVRPQHPTWNQRYTNEAKPFFEEHEHLVVPAGEYPELAQWINNQRTREKEGRLTAERRELLDAIGMIWDTDAEWWRQVVQALTAFSADHGNLDVPRTVTYGTPPRTLRSAISTIRAWHDEKQLTPEQINELTALDFDFIGPITRNWQAGEKALREFFQKYGHIDVPVRATWGKDKFPLGTWRQSLARAVAAGTVKPARLAALADLIPLLKPLAVAPEELRERYLKAAEAYWARDGDLLAKSEETIKIDGDVVKVGNWLKEKRTEHRKGTLDPETFARLDAIGMFWDGDTMPWWRTLKEFRHYVEQNGELPPKKIGGDQPYKLNSWRRRTLKALAAGTLTAEQVAGLETLGVPLN
jgi:hypothetical protein